MTVPRAELEELASDVAAGGNAAPASSITPAAPADPAIFGHLPAGRLADRDVPGRVFVELSPSPDSAAVSADLEHDARVRGRES